MKTVTLSVFLLFLPGQLTIDSFVGKKHDTTEIRKEIRFEVKRDSLQLQINVEKVRLDKTYRVIINKID